MGAHPSSNASRSSGATRKELQRQADLPPDQERLALELNELQDQFATLKAAFDQFFLGLERHNPTPEAEALKKRILALKKQFIRNTALKFRVGNLLARFLTYEQLWTKTLREMEEGVHRRDRARLRRKTAQAAPSPGRRPERRAEPPPAAAAARERAREDWGGILDFFDEELKEGVLSAEPTVSRKASPWEAPTPVAVDFRPPTPPPRARPPPAPQPPANALPLPRSKMLQILHAYRAAKERCQESTEGITLESVAAALRQQIPQALGKSQARQFDVKVVIKGGKAALKTVPK